MAPGVDPVVLLQAAALVASPLWIIAVVAVLFVIDRVVASLFGWRRG